jgi:hypothetical protein
MIAEARGLPTRTLQDRGIRFEESQIDVAMRRFLARPGQRKIADRGGVRDGARLC